MTEEEVRKKQPPRLHAHADMDVLTILYQRHGMILQVVQCSKMPVALHTLGSLPPLISYKLSFSHASIELFSRAN